jgi:hypothetical protein
MFVEVDLLGVYVAPIAPLMVAAWFMTVVLRRFANRFGLLRHVWHPALFVFAVYVIVLSAMVLAIAHWASPWPTPEQNRITATLPPIGA